MIEFLILLLLVAAAVYIVRRERDEEPIPDEIAYRVGVALHDIRRRIELANFKAELRSDAARMRRELRDEMNGDLERLLSERKRP